MLGEGVGTPAVRPAVEGLVRARSEHPRAGVRIPAFGGRHRPPALRVRRAAAWLCATPTYLVAARRRRPGWGEVEAGRGAGSRLGRRSDGQPSGRGRPQRGLRRGGGVSAAAARSGPRAPSGTAYGLVGAGQSRPVREARSGLGSGRPLGLPKPGGPKRRIPVSERSAGRARLGRSCAVRRLPGRRPPQPSVAAERGIRSICPAAVQRDQREVLGPVASTPTAWRLPAAIDERVPDRLRSARAQAREVAWPRAWAGRGRGSTAAQSGGGALPGLVLGLDVTPYTCHSEKDQAAPTCKRGSGVESNCCFNGNAGAWTSARLTARQAGGAAARRGVSRPTHRWRRMTRGASAVVRASGSSCSALRCAVRTSPATALRRVRRLHPHTTDREGSGLGVRRPLPGARSGRRTDRVPGSLRAGRSSAALVRLPSGLPLTRRRHTLREGRACHQENGPDTPCDWSIDAGRGPP